MTDLFDDGKDAAALRTIGELSEALGIRQHVLRYWEEQFPQLTPMKRSGGRRYYRPEDVATVREIDRLVNREGYTLRGARAALGAAPGAGRSGSNVSGVASRPLAEAALVAASAMAGASDRPAGHLIEDTLVRLRSIRHNLAAALGR